MTGRDAVDVVVVGAGHNGLVAGGLLAKAGRRVLVLEARDLPGGQLVPFVHGPDFVAGVHPTARLQREIVRELGLERHGLVPDAQPAPCFASLPDGERLRLGAPGDPATLESIRRHSARDAARWPEFVAWMDRAATFLDVAYSTPMPGLAAGGRGRESWPLAGLALRLRRLGRRDMFGLIRCLSMSAFEFTEEWFESGPLRATVGALGVHGVTAGPTAAGAGLVTLHHWRNRGGLAHRGATQAATRVVEALVGALRAHGGQLRTGAPVARVRVEHGRATGVQLESGEEIQASTVVSTLDPKRTLLGLVGAPELPPEFVWHAQAIRMRGSTAKLHLLTDGRHGLPAGTLVVAPSLDALERAYDDCKYGAISHRPYLEVTTSGPVVALHCQYAPYALREGSWPEARGLLERRAVDTLLESFPGLGASIREVRTLGPIDLEHAFGVTEGQLDHGQLSLDQSFFMRPLPGWANHRTPIDGLWLAGHGVHGGGGVSGTAGRNGARAVLGAPR